MQWINADVRGTSEITVSAHLEEPAITLVALCDTSDMGFLFRAYSLEPGHPKIHLFQMNGTSRRDCENRGWKAFRGTDDWILSGKSETATATRVLHGSTLANGSVAAFVCHKEKVILATSAMSQEIAEAEGTALANRFKALKDP